jgi:hypothetical protein
MFLPWRQHQVTGITQGIDERVDFGGQPSAPLADRLRAVFFAHRRCVDERARWWRRSSCTRCRDRWPAASFHFYARFDEASTLSLFFHFIASAMFWGIERLNCGHPDLTRLDPGNMPH